MRSLKLKLLQFRANSRLKYLVIILLLLSGYFYVYGSNSWKNEAENVYSIPGSFLVDGPSCKIPNMNPFAEEAMKVFTREKYEPCSKKRMLTSVEYFNNTVALLIHETHKSDYLTWWQKDIKCCYKRIVRDSGETADLKVSYTSCKPFTSKFQLEDEDEFILVTCKGFCHFLFWEPAITVYRNGHAIISAKPKVVKKFAQKSKKKKISVFLMGIDSVSRLNLIRGMPETYKHLQQDEGWFELRGYNKIADNTFPNLMAILAGQNLSVIDKVRDWKKPGDVSKCQFLWKDFDAANYATAYAEDESYMSTFNYLETGFIEPPTDHYFRPFTLGAERHLRLRMKHKSMSCLGYQHYADHVYNYGFDFAVKYKDDQSFGIFWTNSFSHEDLSMTSAMDTRVKFYLEQLETLGILNSSIVMFFSDHGMRFGPIRNHFIGWLEERLPFFYIWLPKQFQESHPEIVQALRTNRDRLSSPYDVHITLKHILKMSGGYSEDFEPSALSCPNCQSLFKEISLNRSCSDAGIDKHWCTCVEFQEVDTTSKVVQMAVKQTIKEVNIELAPYPQCAQLKLKEIHSARKSSHKSSIDHLVSFNVKPSNAELEATIRCEDEDCKDYKIIGSVSRLNRYKGQSECVNNSHLRLYCYCS